MTQPPGPILRPDPISPPDPISMAIVSLDLHGYSRLTEQDEIGTHRALMACWRDRLVPAVGAHGGLIVKSTGDGALIRFPQASSAFRAMSRFQRELAIAEVCHPACRRLVFRIGIHLAPAIEEGGDVYGHGVNLAVRLQEAAEPGSIVLSDVAARTLGSETAEHLEDLGRRRFKNIEEQVSIHRWRPAGRSTRHNGLPAIAKAAAVIAVLLAMPPPSSETTEILFVHVAPAIPSETDRVMASSAEIASIAFEQVRQPRTDAGPSPASTEAVERDVSWIAPYRGLGSEPLDGVAWSTMAPSERSLENRSEIAEDAYLQALALYGRHTPESFAKAVVELDYALVMKPGDTAAHALLAAVYWGGLQNRWQLGRGLTWGEMLRLSERHLALVVEPDPLAHRVISERLTAQGFHDQAIQEARRAIELAPARAVGHHAEGRALLYAGRAAEALAPIRQAIRLDPHATPYLVDLALAQFCLNRFDEAERTLARATARNGENDWSHLLMAATQGHLGLKAEARQAIGRFDRLSLQHRGWFASQVPYVHSWPFRDRRDRQRIHLGMVLAGVPDPER